MKGTVAVAVGLGLVANALGSNEENAVKLLQGLKAAEIERRVLNVDGGDLVGGTPDLSVIMPELGKCLATYMGGNNVSESALACLEEEGAFSGSETPTPPAIVAPFTKEKCEAAFTKQTQCLMALDFGLVGEFANDMNKLIEGTNFTAPECSTLNDIGAALQGLKTQLEASGAQSGGDSDGTSDAAFQEQMKSQIKPMRTACEEVAPGSSTSELTPDQKAAVERDYPLGDGSSTTKTYMSVLFAIFTSLLFF